ncbi:MAG: metal-dependent transcriptional regulator [Candidatus Poseidoniales archaeon]|nr:MAG: metal-dependent transcriptional regulator [Candidatus Poseidoniales archaeon]
MGGGHFQEFEDEYLETIYDFHEKFPGERVRNGDLAKYLNVSPASATEMVQRLAKNGYLDYIPYKGAILTPSGMEHGMMMKRRHRLAEVLLSVLPFEGDVHETACRLEHAIDDELEVCISRLLGNPKVDPSGKSIPPPNSRISHRLDGDSDLVSMNKMSNSTSGEIILIMIDSSSSDVVKELGLSVGQIVEKNANEFYCNGKVLQISDDLSSQIVLRCEI